MTSFTVGKLLRWVVEHSQDASFSFSLPRNIWVSILSHVRLVLGGNLRMVLDQRSPVSIVAGAALVVSLVLLISSPGPGPAENSDADARRGKAAAAGSCAVVRNLRRISRLLVAAETPFTGCFTFQA